MVLPLIDEDKPKCYLCHDSFENLERLREHQKTIHKEFFESNKNEVKREPTPGDVTVF